MIEIKSSNTQLRLLYLMQERGLQQKDILQLLEPFCSKYNVKFNKSDISQYVAGKTEPNQDKLYLLSKALDVDVVWLMGYEPERIIQVNESISKDENELLSLYRRLDNEDKIEARAEFRGMAKNMLKSEKYNKKETGLKNA